MGKIVGKGAIKAPSTISIEEYNEMKKNFKEQISALEKKFKNNKSSKNADDSEEIENLNKQISELVSDKTQLEKDLEQAKETIKTLTDDKDSLENKIKELEETKGSNGNDSEGNPSEKENDPEGNDSKNEKKDK